MEGFIESGLQIFVNTLTLKKTKNWITQLNWCHLVTISRWKFLNDKKCEETIYHLSSSCMGVNYYLVSFERRTLFLFSYCQKETISIFSVVFFLVLAYENVSYLNFLPWSFGLERKFCKCWSSKGEDGTHCTVSVFGHCFQTDIFHQMDVHYGSKDCLGVLGIGFWTV